MDEVIGNFFSESGDCIHLTMKDCYKVLYDMTKVLYMDYMTRVLDGDYEDFNKKHLATMGKILDSVHSRCEDHSFGLRKELFDSKGIKDPRKCE